MTITTQYKAVIFDLDGTLLDSLDDLADSMNKMLAQEGYPSRSREEVRKFLGYGAKQLVKSSLPDDIDEAEVERCLKQYQTIYASNRSNKTQPYTGIMQLLQTLQGHDVQMAVVSNKPHTHTVPLVEDVFGKYIPIAMGDQPDIPRKPAPDLVYKALKALDCPAKQALYVGDSEVDVQTAQNAGVPAVGVTWGFRDADVLESHGADYIIQHPEELLTILNIR